MDKASSLAERLRQVEVRRLELEETLEVMQSENEDLQDQLLKAKIQHQEMQGQLEASLADLKRAKATVSAIRSSFRYRLGSRLVTWPLKLRNKLVPKAIPAAREARKKPPERLGADLFRDYLQLLEQKYSAGGLSAAERFAREKFKAPADLSLALMRVARWVIGADLREARRLASEAVAIAPNPSKKKWLAFLLFDAGEITTPCALLGELPPELEFKESERNKAAVIRSCGALLAYSLPIPARAVSPPYIPKPKRVLYVAASSLPYHVSGYTLRTQSILKELRKSGWDISCITRPGYPADRLDTGEAASYAVRLVEDVPYQALQGPPRRGGGLDKYLLESAEIIARHAAQEQAVAIHAASNYENAIPALIAARKLGLPFIYEVRGLWEYTAASKKTGWETTERFELDRKLEALAASSADRVLTLTQALADELSQRGVEVGRMSLAPNGIDVDTYRPVAWDAKLAGLLGVTRGNFVVGYIGSVVAYEGLDDLINAYALLLKQVPSAKLLIVGNGDALPALQRHSENLKLGQNVIFAGKVMPSDVPRYYSLLSVVSLPRKRVRVCELVSPLKPYEVMAMAVPLVVSDVAALKEMVDEGINALVHRAGDVNTLLECLLALAQEPAMGKRMSGLALERVQRRNRWSVVTQLIEHCYLTCINLPAQPSPMSKHTDESAY